jgi:uncharacterized DUF497 family protein
MPEILSDIQGFEWDDGNSGKNEKKHGVTDREAEEIFFNKPLIIGRSIKGQPEMRYAALGKTYGSRLLAVVFTIRAKRLRVISARPMSKKERTLHEKES